MAHYVNPCMYSASILTSLVQPTRPAGPSLTNAQINRPLPCIRISTCIHVNFTVNQCVVTVVTAWGNLEAPPCGCSKETTGDQELDHATQSKLYIVLCQFTKQTSLIVAVT